MICGSSAENTNVITVTLRWLISLQNLSNNWCKVSWESLGLQGDPTSSILKEISLWISLEGMMLKLKLQYSGHLMWRVDSLEKTLMLGGIGGKRKRGTTEDEMAGWHHWLDGREFEWTPGDGDGRGGLACCDSWGRKESDTTERLNWTELKLRSGASLVVQW